MNTIFYKTKQKAASIMFAFITVFALMGLQTASAQMPGGTYTINAGASASSTNFRNFISFSNALRNISRTDGGPLYGAAGISGAITVNVVANSGPYTERVEFFQVTNASSTNTISINGNSNTIQFDATSTTTASIMFLNGADWFRIRNLRFVTLNTNQGHGIRLANAADNNIIENNVFDISSVTSTATSNSSGIRISNSETSNTDYFTGGVRGINNQIIGNEIFGSTTNNGLYCGIVIQGSSAASAQQHNTLIKNNIIRNFYLYGIYDYFYFNGVTFEGNTIYRGTKPTQTTFYGIYSYYNSNKVFNGNWIYDGAPTNVNYTFSAFGIYDYYGTTSNMGQHLMYNNVIAFTNGGYRYGIYGLSYYTTRKEFINNTIYFRHHATSNYIQGYGLYSNHYQYSDNLFYNNIIDIEGSDIRATTYGRYIYNYGRILSDYNIQHKNTNSGSYQYVYMYSLTNGGTGLYNDLASLQAVGFDVNSKNVKPTYRDTVPRTTGILNLIPTSIDLDGAGTPITAVPKDRDGNTRSTTAPDPGAYEFDMPINVSAIVYPNSVCQNNLHDVEVTITNNATIALRNFNVQYSVNGTVQATEVYTSTIQPNTSATYIFTTKMNNATVGNFVLTANVRGKSPVVSKNYSVGASPVGSIITQGTPFNGSFNAGDAQDPDIVAYGDNIRYSITPPTSYTNSDYNSTWVFDYWDLRTTNNVDAGAAHTKTNPSSNNAVSSFTPVIAQSDETFILRYAIRSLTNGCIAPEVSRRIFVAPRPVASFTANAVCEGDAMQFNNTSTISTGNNTYKWEFGTGDETNLIDPTYTYPATGTYSVTLTATSNYGYSNSITQNVTVNPNPTADFIWNNECEGTAIQFTDASVIPGGTPSYEWTFGDGSTSIANSPAKTYAQTGTYAVTMKVTSLGCTGTATGYATLKPMPMASFTSSPAVCNSEKISFTNNSSISNGTVGYNWNFGDNTSSTLKNPSKNYNGFGTYNVVLTATSGLGCVATANGTVTLKESPVVDFTTGSLCDKDNVAFNNTSTVPSGETATYTWTFGDNTTANTVAPTHSFPSIGNYMVTLESFASNGCGNKISKSIMVEEKPMASFFADKVCEGDFTQFNNASVASTNLSYNWNLGGGNTSTDQNPSVKMPAGKTSVTLTVSTPGGCTETATEEVEVTANPTAAITNITGANLGDPTGQMGSGTMVIQATATNGANYILFFGDGNRKEGVSTGTINETHNYAFDKTYTVSIRASIDGCSAEANAQAAVFRTNVAEVVNGSLKVYPNPSNAKFFVDLSALGTNEASVLVYASNGQLVRSVSSNQFNNAVEIDLGNEAAGIYNIAVHVAGVVYNAKVSLNK